MCIDASVIVGRCPICLYIILNFESEVKTLNVKEMSRGDIERFKLFFILLVEALHVQLNFYLH